MIEEMHFEDCDGGVTLVMTTGLPGNIVGELTR